jgi:hypothetical protein
LLHLSGSPPDAVEAPPAGHRTRSRPSNVDVVTYFEAGDAVSYLDDVSCDFVARAGREGGEGVEPLVEMEVTSADEAGSVSEHNLVGTGIRELNVEPFEMVGLYDHGSLEFYTQEHSTRCARATKTT